MAELSRYQQSIVKRYYENLDTKLLQRLGEQVTDLYLAPKSRIDHLQSTDDARKLADLVNELHGKA
ncbi:hypothetical protein EBU58_03580 [bacterium]|nr:hypothetical protein [bacterium]